MEMKIWVSCFFFFFQAEDGIRDRNVTGVQTCALPILVDGWRPDRAGRLKLSSFAGALVEPDENFLRTRRQARLVVFVAGLACQLSKGGDRKSTRLNSSHVSISYAVFCLKKKKKKIISI